MLESVEAVNVPNDPIEFVTNILEFLESQVNFRGKIFTSCFQCFRF